MGTADASIDAVQVRAYRIPTDAPEADGTLSWDSTTLVVVQISGGGRTGVGFTYGTGSGALLIEQSLAPRLLGEDPFQIPKLWQAMVAAVRNVGWPGVAATAVSAIDIALWDLKARLLDVPLLTLFGACRTAAPIYGSGGFTSYEPESLVEQLAGWVQASGCRSVKMKIGAEPEQDLKRVALAARGIGDAALMVDANGAYEPKFALLQAQRFAEHNVTWFEEPVSSDDLAGLRRLRDRMPAEIEVAAGEYAYDPGYVLRMIGAGAVDVMQLDATRLCGFTGFLKAAAIAEAHHVSVSAHTAPALHLAVCCAIPRLRHVEWFHDHARIEAMLFDGVPKPVDGQIMPDLMRPGHGLEFKEREAERFAA